jgi:hypothetical protein
MPPWSFCGSTIAPTSTGAVDASTTGVGPSQKRGSGGGKPQVSAANPPWSFVPSPPSDTLQLHAPQGRRQPHFFATLDAPVADIEAEGSVQGCSLNLVDAFKQLGQGAP